MGVEVRPVVFSLFNGLKKKQNKTIKKWEIYIRGYKGQKVYNLRVMFVLFFFFFFRPTWSKQQLSLQSLITIWSSLSYEIFVE